MTPSRDLYSAIGKAPGCRALSKAFYARVARDPLLRPLFPSTFKCAIEQFAAFLVQFLGGEAESTQDRWELSLQQSHSHFCIGAALRDSWLKAMEKTLEDTSLIPQASVRGELLVLFRHASLHVVNELKHKPDLPPMTDECQQLWDEQVALDGAIALLRRSGRESQCIELLQCAALQARFARSPAVHANIVAMTAVAGAAELRRYAVGCLNAKPSLASERYKRNRTILHDVAAAGDAEFVELLLRIEDCRSASDAPAASPLYCVANECTTPGASRIVHALLRSGRAKIDTAYGPKRCTELHMAARRGNEEVIVALLDCGADIEARDSKGETPLRRAVNCNQLQAARLLLSKGADPRSRSRSGGTPASSARTAQMKRLFE